MSNLLPVTKEVSDYSEDELFTHFYNKGSAMNNILVV